MRACKCAHANARMQLHACKCTHAIARMQMHARKCAHANVGMQMWACKCGHANKNVEELWNILKSKLMDLQSKFVPQVKSLGKPTWRVKGSFPINKQLQDATRGKHTTHWHWMSARKLSDANDARLRYIRERNKVKSLLQTFERGIARKAKSNPKAF